MFKRYLENLSQLIGAGRSIKIFIESINTGFQIKSDFKGIIIEDTKTKEQINYIDFIDRMNEVSLIEQIMFSNGKHKNKLDTTTQETLSIERRYHFVFETRMLIFETVFRDLNKDDTEYINLLNYSLYKHLVIYYNCRAKKQPTNSSGTNNLTLVCSNFKGLYVSIPNFTELLLNGGEKIEKRVFPEIHIDNNIPGLIPTLSLDISPANVLPAQLSNMVNFEEKLSIYTLSNLAESLANMFGGSRLDIKKYFDYEFLKQTSYTSLKLFSIYWYPDYLYFRSQLLEGNDTKFNLMCIINNVDAKNFLAISYIKSYDMREFVPTLVDKGYDKEEITEVFKNIKNIPATIKNSLGNCWLKYKEG